MKFKIITEGITFIDATRDENGNFIDDATGLPVSPSTTHIFWDDDSEKSKLTKPTIPVDDKGDNPSDEDDDDDIDDIDIDDDEIDIDNVKIGNKPKPGKPFPIADLLEKLIKKMEERNDWMDSNNVYDSISYSSAYGDIRRNLNEIKKRLDLRQLKEMLKCAKEILRIVSEVNSKLDGIHYDYDEELRSVSIKFLRNAKLLVKLLENSTTPPPTDPEREKEFWIDNGTVYRNDKNGNKIKVKRYGTNEV